MNPLVNEIKSILDIARSNVARAVNNELITSYWKIGEIIVRYEQNDNKELYRILQKEYSLNISNYKKEIIILNPDSDKKTSLNNESKNYINRGWRYNKN